MASVDSERAPFWTRRRRLLWAFLLGPLTVLVGVYYLVNEGLNFYAGWYLLIGGLLLAFGFRDLLTGALPRTREDAFRVFARTPTLLILLLLGFSGILVMTVLSYLSWTDRILRFAMYVAFWLLVFVYARRWQSRHPADAGVGRK